MFIKKTLMPTGLELEKILNQHRKAIEQCDIPEDDEIYKILEKCESDIIAAVSELVDEAFIIGISEAQ